MTDDACACRAAFASPSRTTATTSDVRAGPTRSSSRSSSTPPSTTRDAVQADDERRREAEAGARERRLPAQPLDEAGGGVGVVQLVDDLPDLAHRGVDVVADELEPGQQNMVDEAAIADHADATSNKGNEAEQRIDHTNRNR